MNTIHEVRYASSPAAVKQYDTTSLRQEFLIEDLMKPNEVFLVYSYCDRYIAGSAVAMKEFLML